jgi:hypothetical protein
MADQSIKLVALVSQNASLVETLNVRQLLENNLAEKYAYLTQRFQTAVLYSALTTAGVLIALITISALNLLNIRPIPEMYRLYAPFVEWQSDGTRQFVVCAWNCEIATQATRLLNATSDIGASIFADAGQGSVASIARLCSLISVFFAVWFTYRKQLVTWYRLNMQEAQRQDFEQMPRWQFWLTRALFTIASLFGTYVIVSILWLGLSLIFKDMTMNWINALIVIILFISTTTLIATYCALAVTTREILLLGLMIFVVGFSASFALTKPYADHQWWQIAVSNAGQLNPAASLFTGTLLSGSLTLIVLWFDIDSILQKMVGDGDVRWFSANLWMWVARGLYIVLVLGLMFIGLIRVDQTNYPFNMVFHAGGAILAIASVIVSGLLIRKRRFHPWYKLFSVQILLGLTVSMSVLGSLKLDPPAVVFPGTGIISLVVIELSLFVLIGLWIYATVDNLLGQANLNAFDGQLMLVIQQDHSVT